MEKGKKKRNQFLFLYDQNGLKIVTFQVKFMNHALAQSGRHILDETIPNYFSNLQYSENYRVGSQNGKNVSGYIVPETHCISKIN